MTKPRVLLADDHTLLLEAFQRLLAMPATWWAVSNAGICAGRTSCARRVVVDIAMPLLNGLDARARSGRPSRRSNHLLTMNEDPDLARRRSVRSIRVPPQTISRIGMLTPSGRRRSITRTSRRSHRGLVGSMLHGWKAGRRADARQREILQLVAEGTR